MNTEIEKKVIAMLETGDSYAKIQSELNLYPTQIKRIKDKYVNTNNNTNIINDNTNENNDNTNGSTNSNNVSTNNTNVPDKDSKEMLKLKLQLQQGEIEKLKLLQKHELDLEEQKHEHEIELEEMHEEKLRLKEEKELERKEEEEHNKFIDNILRKKNEPDELDEIDEDNEPDEDDETTEPPQIKEVVYWANKDVEGEIVNIKNDIVEVAFDNEEIEIPISKLSESENGDVWIYDNTKEESEKFLRKIRRDREKRERLKNHL